MQIDAVQTPLSEADTRLVAVAATTDGDDAILASDPGDLGVDLAAAMADVGFTGASDTIARVPRPTGGSVLLVGCGDVLTVDGVRRFAANVARSAKDVARLAVQVPAVEGISLGDVSAAVAEGLVLGEYRFIAHRTESEPVALAAAVVHGADADALAAGAIAAEAAVLARDLVNTPPNHKRPPALAQRAVDIVSGSGIEVTVLDDEELLERGYGGLIAVGAGSSAGPRVVELTWAPDDATGDHIALVGKGITFDTGGISLKPSASMETMKMDMGGAAVVLSVLLAAARLELPIRLTGVMCLAENMPSGTAQRVSDVYTALDGTTVEVLNTDAEGRLVLADGIVHAGRMGADVIIDIATLTGAATVALGDRFSVVMSNDDDLASALTAAGLTAGEPMWQLPLAVDEYMDRLESDVADIKNVAGRQAGTITAGLFLHRFVPEETRWAHLDIAGSAWTERAVGILAKGATGVPVRALLTWLRGLA